MLTKSIAKIALAALVALASMSPTLAAKRYTHMPNPCAKTQLRCYADCDKFHWCKVYACSANQTIMLPLPCNEQSGPCWAPHC